MSHILMLYGIYTIGIILLSLLLILLPLDFLSALTAPFSFKTFGLRKIKRWNAWTDTLGNFFTWISVIFCIVYPLVPYARFVFAGWMLFSWLACVSRAVRLSEVPSAVKKMTVIFFINLIFGFGLAVGLGAYDNGGLWSRVMVWVEDLLNGQARYFMYILTSPNVICYLLQMLLMLIPLCSLWGQFKYMRLENTFKARNLFTYSVKYTLMLVVLVALGVFGLKGINKVYKVEEQARYNELLETADLKIEEEKQIEEQARKEKEEEQKTEAKEQEQTEPSVSEESEAH